MTLFEAIRHALTDFYVKGKFTVENPAIVKTADGYAYQSSEYPHEGIELDLKNGLPKTIQPKEAASIDDIAEWIADALDLGLYVNPMNILELEPQPQGPDVFLVIEDYYYESIIIRGVRYNEKEALKFMNEIESAAKPPHKADEYRVEKWTDGSEKGMVIERKSFY
jgi:hypothetical protein